MHTDVLASNGDDAGANWLKRLDKREVKPKRLKVSIL